MNQLILKFDQDVQKRSRVRRLLLVLDQTLNVLFWNGSQDETVSSHIGRRIAANKAFKPEIWLCCILKFLEKNHCHKSLGE